MPVIYSKVDRESWINAPSFVRSRARYRGVRETQKLNVEMSSFLYDIRKLYEKYQSIGEIIAINLEAIREGGILNASIYYYDDTQQGIHLEGVTSLAERVQRLAERIRNLE